MADPQIHVSRQLAFNRQVPLRRLGIPIGDRRVLIEVRSSDELLNCGGVKGRGKLVTGRAGYGISVRVGADDGACYVGYIERQLAQVCHREDAKASSDHRSAILEWPVR